MWRQWCSSLRTAWTPLFIRYVVLVISMWVNYASTHLGSHNVSINITNPGVTQIIANHMIYVLPAILCDSVIDSTNIRLNIFIFWHLKRPSIMVYLHTFTFNLATGDAVWYESSLPRTAPALKSFIIYISFNFRCEFWFDLFLLMVVACIKERCHAIFQPVNLTHTFF